jgi:hypothetical protein
MALGDTFGWGDIGAYLVGIASGGAIEWMAGRVCRGRSAESIAAPNRGKPL